MIVLDASVLIAHLDPFDAHHDVATGVLLAADPEEHLLVHTITLAEVLVGGVKVGKGGEMQADLRTAGVRLARHDDDEPLRLAELRTRTRLKLPDCCVLIAALDNRATLATFDRALAIAAGRLGVPVVP
ncbi:MAG: type II toxin-antitoxin system VapC family toxin [Actinomycetota bacterium]|nr:type II toxin-antitoxin system VapC family toxin [Actinomycetota bacterium]